MQEPPAGGAEGFAIAATLGGAAVLVMVLLALWRALRRRGVPGAGVALELGLVTVPAAAASILLPSEDQVTGYLFWRAAITVAVLSGVHAGLTVLDQSLFGVRRGGAPRQVLVPKIFRDAVRWVLLVLAFLVVLAAVWGFQVGQISVLAGALTIALSLALGPTLGSLISGITLISERPFEIGDWIDVDGKQGRVEQITWRSTRIVTRDHERVVYPNSLLASTRIVNLSRPEVSVGIRTRVGVHYRTPPLAAEDALRRAVHGVPGVLPQHEATFRIVDFSDSAVTWEVRFFVDDPAVAEAARGEVMGRIWYSLHRAGIEIPYPIRNLVTRDDGWDRGTEGPGGESARVLRNVGILGAIPVFEGLPADCLRNLAVAARDEPFLHGERIVVEGEMGDRMFALVRGKVRVVVGTGGGDQEVAVLEPGAYFGEMSLLTGAPRAASVVAEGAVEAISVAAPTLAALLREHPEFAQRMAEAAASRRSTLEERSARLRESRIAKEIPVTPPSILGGIIRFLGLDRGAQKGKNP